MNIARFLNQTTSYTTPGINDGFGGKSGGQSSNLKCRWVDKHALVRGVDKEILSKAVIITKKLLSVGGRLKLIDGIDDQEGIIVAVASIPSVNADVKLNKAWIV